MKCFQTNDVVIRKFKKNDIEKIHEQFNSNNKISNISDMVITEIKDEAQKIVEFTMIDYYTEEPIWVLEDKENKKLFGFIKIENYSPKNKICSISWVLIDNYSNERLFVKAFRKIINYLFKKGIELIECSYYEPNKDTGKILNNIGMKKEAVLKKRRYNELTKQKEDYVIYSIDMEAFNSIIKCGCI